MAQWCLVLAVVSPLSLVLGWWLVSIPAGGTMFRGEKLPFLVLLALSPLTFLASAVLGIKQVLDGAKSGTWALAAGLVLDYCWFHFACAVFIIAQVRGR